MKNSLLKNSILKSLLSICNIIIPLIVGPYVTRLLNIELYGAFNKVIAEFNVFLTVATFGVYTYGVKEISKIRTDSEKVSELFTNLFVLSLLTNSVVMIVYIIYSRITSSGITLTLYMITLILFAANMIYVEYVNEALENYKYITKKTLIVRVIYLVCVIMFVRNPNDILIYAVIFCMSTFVNNFLSYIYIRKQLSFDLTKIHVSKYFKPLLLVFLVSSSEILYFQLDKVFLGKIVSDVAVTVYQIPYLIMSRIITVPSSVIYVSIPRLSNLYIESKKKYEKKLNDVLSYFLIMVLPICFGIFVISNEIIFLYAGEKYMESVSVLKSLSLIRILIGLESFMSLLIFYINNKEKQLLKIFATYGIINALFKVILVNFFKLTPLNASITTGICYFALIATQYIYIKKYLLIKLEIFTKRNITYFILSLLFIPISLIVREMEFTFAVRTLLIIFTCVLEYCGILLLKKDKIFIRVINKFTLRKEKKK